MFPHPESGASVRRLCGEFRKMGLTTNETKYAKTDQPENMPGRRPAFRGRLAGKAAHTPRLRSPSANIREIRGLKNPQPKPSRLRHCSGGVQRIKATA